MPGIVPIVGERRPRVIVNIQPAVGAGRRLARKHSCDEASGPGFFYKGSRGVLTAKVQSFGEAKKFTTINVSISEYLELAVHTDLY